LYLPPALIAGAFLGAIAGGTTQLAIAFFRRLRFGWRSTLPESRWERAFCSTPWWLWALLALATVAAVCLLWYFQPWDPIGPLGYYRLGLGMSEPEMVRILGDPAREYRRSRHLGGITSPGMATVLHREFGLPFEELPKRYGEKARNGQNVTL